MRELSSKKEVFRYFTKKFLTSSVKGIVVLGSTAKRRLRNFSDVDVVVFNKKPLKPYYELCLVRNNLILITAYFYRAGKAMKVPKNGKILSGSYFTQVEHKDHLTYSAEERVKRDQQIFLDGMFKFLRSKDKHYLKLVEKYRKY